MQQHLHEVGSGHPLMQQSRAMARQGEERLREAVASLAAAEQSITEYISEIGGSATTPTAVSPPVATKAGPGGRPAPGQYEAAAVWARHCYDHIRAHDDTQRIARNLRAHRRSNGLTGFSTDEIREIRQHLFFAEHMLDSYDDEPPRRARFDPDENIAEAWSRLREGRPQREDIVLLEHELAESRHMSEHPEVTYRQAHRAANMTANWEQQIPTATRETFSTEWR